MGNNFYFTNRKRYLEQFLENYEKYSVPSNTKLFSRKQDQSKNNLRVLYVVKATNLKKLLTFFISKKTLINKFELSTMPYFYCL